jgi:periplasmic protein TonB
MKYLAAYAICFFITACASPPATIDHPVLPPEQSNVPEPVPVPAPEEVRIDPEKDRARSITQREAEIDAMLRRYSTYPRKAFVSPRTKDSPFSSYMQEWQKKVEDLGSLKFPKGENGKALYGNVLLSIEIDRKGHLLNVSVERTSGNEALDKAAKKIVQMAAPFQPLPPETARETDILVMVNTFHFQKIPAASDKH